MIKSRQKTEALLNQNSRLKFAIEKLGIYDTYVVDDFVIEKHDSFLLRKGTVGEEIDLYCNEDSKEFERDAIVSKVIIAGENCGLRIKMAGLCSLHSRNKNKIKIEFRK